MSANSKNEPQKVKTIESMEYAITISLKPHIYRNDIDKQLEITMTEIREFLSNTKATGLLVTELTKASNIHYHGILKFNVNEQLCKRIPFMLNDYFRKSKIIGFICTKQLTDQIGWIQYMLKNYSDTKDLMKINPIRFNKGITEISEEFGIITQYPYLTHEEITKYKDIEDSLPAD